MKVLGIERLVEAVFATNPLNEFCIGLFSGQKHGWVPRHHMEEGKRDQGDPEKDREKHDQALQDVTGHFSNGIA